MHLSTTTTTTLLACLSALPLLTHAQIDYKYMGIQNCNRGASGNGWCELGHYWTFCCRLDAAGNFHYKKVIYTPNDWSDKCEDNGIQGFTYCAY